MRINKKNRQNAALKKSRPSGLRQKTGIAVLIFIPVVLISAALWFAFSVKNPVFRLSRISFTGSEHLTDEELLAVSGLRKGENLLGLSAKKVHAKMLESPWIKAVSVRKELPDRLQIAITETEPFALLEMKGHLFIVDEQGKLLEELKDSPVPFLPVITGNPFGNKEVFTEAIMFARAIKDAGLLSRKDHIEIIADKPQDMSANMDGIVVKVGTGDYGTKISRLMELEEEIRNRNIPVDYIDLRFSNKVVVKPVASVAKR